VRNSTPLDVAKFGERSLEQIPNLFISTCGVDSAKLPGSHEKMGFRRRCDCEFECECERMFERDVECNLEFNMKFDVKFPLSER